MKIKKLILGIGIISFMLVFTQCTKDEIIVDGLTSSELDAKGGKDITTSEEGTAGNNLSFPVIWSDGVEKPMNGTMGESSLLGEFYGVWGVAGTCVANGFVTDDQSAKPYYPESLGDELRASIYIYLHYHVFFRGVVGVN